MIQALGFFLISAVSTAVLYPAFINFLYRLQLKEAINPDAPRTHFVKAGTPTAAGLLPILLFVVLNLIFNRSAEVVALVSITGALAALGLLEDFFKIYHRSKLQRTIRSQIVPIVTMSDLSWNLYKLALFPWRAFKEVFRALGSQQAGGIKTYQKVLYQTTVGVFLAAWLVFRFGTFVWVPFWGQFDLGFFFLPAVLLLFLFFVNSVDITNGLDGLVGGLLVSAFTALMALAIYLGKQDLAVSAAILLGGLFPFLYFNIFPARVFSGNVAGIAWGGAFVALTLLLDRMLVMPILGGMFLAEGLSVLIQVGSVKMGRGRVFLMAPLHHHFEMKGWAETKVTMRFWLFGGFLAFLGLFLALL